MLHQVILLSILCAFCSSQKCGQSDKITRIVGGTDTQILAYPWQVKMIVQFRTRYANRIIQQSCGASLIDDQWILTAAHCFESPSGSRGMSGVILTLGEHNTAVKEGTEVETKASVVKIHENFNSNTIENDIAMVKMNIKLDLNGKHSYLQPICLPTKGVSVNGDECHASGWGRTSSNGPDSSVLKHVKLPLMKQSTCEGMWGTMMSDNKVCAGVITGGYDTCQGDSGGPLSCPLANGVWVLEGITSFGAECGKAGAAGVYTKVENYLDWIKRIKAKY